MDIMQMAGASPDAIVTNKDTGAPLAVFEAKCKVPFYRHSIGESPLWMSCAL
jgi:hypothetical protein